MGLAQRGQWESSLAVVVERDGKPVEKTMQLSGDWKESDIAWRASSWTGLRQGLKVTGISGVDREKRHLPTEGLALNVEGIFGKKGLGTWPRRV